ncbi:putative calcium-transporting ATPase 13, plasma membrane-type [Camellia lanceoleosa]|uniref:Calcium-transporting ATPase 13, plasma membrane-type n=1 Tax=Camellia lanceoleosa TaxID=1840588 RepID=A0ACC0GWY4_9ERIC|nr:putative calcium-transporting ATPase 13, plasma membrane-type [Camellia lanceoleosa]
MIYKSTETNNTCKQLKDLSKVTANIQSKVIRNGSLVRVPVSEIVVGDVVVLATGDVVPADGLVLGGDDWFYVDESIWKGKGNIVRASRTQNPFLIVVSKVVNGYAGMLVISVGINTTWGNRIRLVTSNPDGFLVERVWI